jgi:hypothetical protein
MIGTEKLMNNLNHEKLEISIHSILNKILNLDNIKVEPILKRFKNSFLSKKILQLLFKKKISQNYHHNRKLKKQTTIIN